MLADVLKSMRPKQWVKNLVVFAALLFVPGAVKQPDCWMYVTGAFAAFCLIAGGVYLINDVLDKPKDILHPRKKLRPIASGKLPAGAAIAFAIVAFIVGVIMCSAIDGIAVKPLFPETSPVYYGLTIIAIAYFFLMNLYSVFLKREIILDVLILSVGFVMRAVAGGFALGVHISPWLLATTLFISLFLAFGKRRGEMKDLDECAGDHREVLNRYSVPLLDSLLVVCAGANIMSYSLYTFLHDLGNSANGGPNGSSAQLMFTVPFVIYGIFRYLHLVMKHDLGASPDEVLTSDKRLMICMALWVITVLFMLSIR